MTDEIPQQVAESDLDDTQSVDFDINDLYDRFILPIEQKRSMSAPNLLTTTSVRNKSNKSQNSQDDLNNAFVDNNFPQESRAHAFYRMIGLPVLDINGFFYNPGHPGRFNPEKDATAISNNEATGNSPDPNVLKMQINRENEARFRAQIFKRSLLNSSIIALGLRFLKPFNVIKRGAAFNTYDAQNFSIPDRKNYISDTYEQANGKPITDFFDSGTHVIKPFLVNAVIDRTVMPASRQVCEPFLKNKQSTFLEQNIFIDRPGIELILRIRLKQNADKNLLPSIIASLNPTVEINAENITTSDLLNIATALFDKANVDKSEVLKTVSSVLTTEISTINNLVKLIKALVNKLINSIHVLKDVSDGPNAIDWTPLPGELGPEDQKKLVISKAAIRLKTSTSELERRINQLSVKSTIAQNLNVPSDDDIGNFALSYFEHTEQLFLNALNEAKEQKNHYISAGAQALRNIEIITGEISGLGLIDVLSMYTALWAIDLDVLISLLDPNAFDRLVKYNKELINSNVQKRIDKGGEPVMSASEALQKLEDQIVNILSFADSVFQNAISTSKIVEGGSSPQG
jgi:hypothetical protein